MASYHRGEVLVCISVLGSRVRSRREELGLAQSVVADTAGISRPILSMVESGEKMLTVVQLVQLAELLDVTTDWLLGRV